MEEKKKRGRPKKVVSEETTEKKVEKKTKTSKQTKKVETTKTEKKAKPVKKVEPKIEKTVSVKESEIKIAEPIQKTEVKVLKKETFPFLLVILASLFTAIYVISNVIASKSLDLMRTSVSASVIAYPFLFVISNIIQEKYGEKYTRNVILLTAGIMLTVGVIMVIARALTGVDNLSTSAFDILFKEYFVTTLCSIFAFLISQFINLKLYATYRMENINRIIGYLIAIAVSLGVDAILFHGLLTMSLSYVEFNWQEVLGRFIVGLGLIAIVSPLFYIMTETASEK